MIPYLYLAPAHRVRVGRRLSGFFTPKLPAWKAMTLSIRGCPGIPVWRPATHEAGRLGLYYTFYTRYQQPVRTFPASCVAVKNADNTYPEVQKAMFPERGFFIPGMPVFSGGWIYPWFLHGRTGAGKGSAKPRRPPDRPLYL